VLLDGRFNRLNGFGYKGSLRLGTAEIIAIGCCESCGYNMGTGILVVRKMEFSGKYYLGIV
jgi:hypothetical protein